MTTSKSRNMVAAQLRTAALRNVTLLFPCKSPGRGQSESGPKKLRWRCFIRTEHLQYLVQSVSWYRGGSMRERRPGKGQFEDSLSHRLRRADIIIWTPDTAEDGRTPQPQQLNQTSHGEVARHFATFLPEVDKVC